MDEVFHSRLTSALIKFLLLFVPTAADAGSRHRAAGGIRIGMPAGPAVQDLSAPSSSAHARATDESGDAAPGIVAHPPFSIKAPCCQLLIFFSSTRFSGAFVVWRNLSTQIGASASTTALLALFCVISCAVRPVTQPPQ